MARKPKGLPYRDSECSAKGSNQGACLWDATLDGLVVGYVITSHGLVGLSRLNHPKEAFTSMTFVYGGRMYFRTWPKYIRTTGPLTLRAKQFAGSVVEKHEKKEKVKP